MQVKEYALYKGDELLAMGTKREIAKQLGCPLALLGTTVRRYTLEEPVRMEGD